MPLPVARRDRLEGDRLPPAPAPCLMCLILLAHRAHPRWRLVVAANRDEAYARPTAPAGWWSDAPEVLAGRDLRAGGTWMGITRAGRFAAVTNVREWPLPPAAPLSRGHLVSGFLLGQQRAEAYLASLSPSEYAGYNLLVSEADGELWYASNRGGEAAPVADGIHGLSNALLDTPWPKVRRGTAGLAALLSHPAGPDEDALFRLLADADPAPDPDLPDTGIGQAGERALSSLFIATPDYGTRASTVLLVGYDGEVRLVERTVVPGGAERPEARFEFSVG